MQNYEMMFSARDVYPTWMGSVATHEMTIPDMVERNIYPAVPNGEGNLKTSNDVEMRTNYGLIIVGVIGFLVFLNFIK